MYDFIDIDPDAEDAQPLSIKKLVPDNFMGILVGPTGAGKTRLVKKMLDNDKIWQNHHEKIIYVTPTERPDFSNSSFKDRLEFLSTFDMTVIMEKVKAINEDIKLEKIDDDEHIDILDRFSRKKPFIGNNKLCNQLKEGFSETKQVSKSRDLDVINSIDFFKTNDTKLGGKRFVLLILDDCLAELAKNKHSTDFAKMFFNRRWIGGNFVLNILINIRDFT